MENISKISAERNSSIELLRILAIMGVIVLHYNNQAMGGGLMYVEQKSLNHFALLALEAMFICAVNVFVLITGYFMVTSQKRNIVKPFGLLLQVVVFRILTLMANYVMNNQLSVKGLIGCLLPVNYFVILYCTLYFVSPYLNIILKKLSSAQLKCMMICLILLFSVWPTLVDVLQFTTKNEYMGLSTIGMYGSQYGYTIIHFVLMYLIGGSIRICETDGKKIRGRIYKLIVIWLCVVAFIVLWSLYDANSSWEYCNPLVIIESVVVFLLFKNLNFKSRIVNSLSKATFTVFLVHTNFFRWLYIDKYVNMSLITMLLHIMISCISIFVICYFIWLIYDLVTRPLFKLLNKIFKPYCIDVEDNYENTFC